MSGIYSVSLEGDEQVRAMLQKWMEPQLTKRAQRATKKSANVLKGPLRSAAKPLSKRMASSVYVHVARRDRPAYVVGHHRRKAFFWHMVIGGTKDHSLTPRKAGKRVRSGYPTVRGVPAHPIVSQVAAQYGEQAYRALIDDLSRDE